MSENSKDELLKKDMPPAIMAIENATRLLSEAAEGLRQETQSPDDKKKLLDGSRGACVCVCVWFRFAKY